MKTSHSVDETIRITMECAAENPSATSINGVTAQDLANAFAACAWEITMHGEPAKARAANYRAELISLQGRIDRAIAMCCEIERTDNEPAWCAARSIREQLEKR